MPKMVHLLYILIVFGFTSAQAAVMCKDLFFETGKDVSVQHHANRNLPSELNLIGKAFDATGNSVKVSLEVSELINMMASSRSPIINGKEINEKGRLILGLPVGSGFVLELKYRANFTEGAKYVLDHINLLSPSGKQIDVSANPLDLYSDRILSRDRTNFEIGSYPDGYNITAKIPTVIMGDVLKEIQLLSPKLELLPKEVIREIARESNLKELKSKANKAYMKYFIKRYSFRGVFKTLFKLTVYEPLKIVLTAGILYVAASTVGITSNHSISEFFMPKQNTEWVAKSINESAQSKKLPANVKNQLQTLQSDLESHSTDAIQTKNNQAVDQNAAKLQVTKDQYLWTTTMTDKETGRSSTIIFISRDNQQGQISYAAIQVDPAKYQSLISYIKSIGQFIPVSDEDLK